MSGTTNVNDQLGQTPMNAQITDTRDSRRGPGALPSIDAPRAAALILITLAAILASGCESESVAVQTETTRPAVVHTVATSNTQTSIEFPGRVEARHSVNVGFRVGGPLISVDVKEGQTIKQGDVIARIDPRDYKLQVQALSASASATKAQRDQVKLDRARAEKLVKEEALAGAQLEQADTGLKISKAQVRGTQTSLKMARTALKDTTLESPFSGRVAKVMVENHQTVGPAQPIVTLQDLSRFRVRFYIPERDMPDLQKDGNNIKVSFEVEGDRTFDARVVKFGTVIDAQTQSYPVTLEVQAEESMQILPGMSATVVWTRKGGAQPSHLVPLSAVATYPSGESKVWAVTADNTLQGKAVKLGVIRDSGVEILEGVQAGDIILGRGVNAAIEGMRIKPLQKVGVN